MYQPTFESCFTIFDRKIQHAPSFSPNLNPAYAVKGLLNIGESSVLYGPPALGKTSIVCAIGAHAALGRDFADCLTQETVVLYFAAEDNAGVHKRAYPYLSAPEFARAPFYVAPTGFDMTSSTSASEVINLITRLMDTHRIPQSLIIFDTLNRMLGVSDENSSSVIGTYMANAERVAKEANAACLTIHHSGKNDASSLRGSSAIEGGADNVFRLSRSKEDRSLVYIIPQKTKSMADTKTLAFRIEAHFIGYDRDGEAVSVPKAVPQGATGFNSRTPANVNRQPNSSAIIRATEVYEILRREAGLEGSIGLTPKQVAEHADEAFREVSNNRDSLLRAVKRSLQALVENGRAQVKEGRFTALRSTDD